MIMLSLFGMLSLVGIPLTGRGLNAAAVLIVLGSLYYFWLGWRFGVAMLVFSAILYMVGVSIPFWLNVMIFGAGWILQFIGHGVYEGRSPAFLKNLVHLLVGPIWIVNDLLPDTFNARDAGEARG